LLQNGSKTQNALQFADFTGKNIDSHFDDKNGLCCDFDKQTVCRISSQFILLLTTISITARLGVFTCRRGMDSHFRSRVNFKLNRASSLAE